MIKKDHFNNPKTSTINTIKQRKPTGEKLGISTIIVDIFNIAPSVEK